MPICFLELRWPNPRNKKLGRLALRWQHQTHGSFARPPLCDMLLLPKARVRRWASMSSETMLLFLQFRHSPSLEKEMSARSAQEKEMSARSVHEKGMSARSAHHSTPALSIFLPIYPSMFLSTHRRVCSRGAFGPFEVSGPLRPRSSQKTSETSPFARDDSTEKFIFKPVLFRVPLDPWIGYYLGPPMLYNIRRSTANVKRSPASNHLGVSSSEI